MIALAGAHSCQVFVGEDEDLDEEVLAAQDGLAFGPNGVRLISSIGASEWCRL